MRILVFDDNEINRAAAYAQLKDHDLTVVGTYDEAQELLTPQVDEDKVSSILKNQFGDKEEERDLMKYFAAIDMARQQAIIYPAFDVVLTDLLVPASSWMQGEKGREFVGKEMPLGIFIGLMAAVRARAKYVAVFTDKGHHSHPASACFDVFNPEGEYEPKAFMVEGSKVLLCNARNWINEFRPENLVEEISDEERKNNLPSVHAKNWRKLFDYLITA